MEADPAVATSTVCCMQTAVKLMEARVDSVKAAVSTSQQAAQTHADTPPTTSTSTAAGISTAAPQASAHPDRSAAGKESSSSVVGTSASAAAASRSAAAGQPSSADQPPEVGVSTATKAQDAATPSTSASAAPTPVSTATNATLPQLPMSAAPTSVSTATDAAVPQVPMSAVLSVDTRADARGPAGEGSAALQAEAARKEMADLESVLEDMYEKVEELQQIVKEQISTKNALKVSAVSVVFGGMKCVGDGLCDAVSVVVCVMMCRLWIV